MKNNSLKIFITFFSLFFLLQAKAQVDSKYLAGAVPEINGKVVFSDTILLQGMSQNDIYEKAILWAEANYNTEKSRVAYIDKEKGIISCRGESELVFSSGALSLDRTIMNYQLNIFCSDGLCKTDIKTISYQYGVASKKEPEKYLAEEWITDKEAVNKDKLYRNNGKFRIKTIDLVDDIYNSLSYTISTGEIDLYYEKDKKLYTRRNQAPVIATASQQTATKEIPTPQVREPMPATTVSAAATSAVPAATLSSYKKIEPEKLPGNIIKMLNNDWMLITAGNNSKFNMTTANWGGLGVLWEKPAAFCFINPADYTYQLLETGETYTLSFYTETYRDALLYCKQNTGKDVDKAKETGLTPITLPSGCISFGEAWMIIECKKILNQPLSEGNNKNTQNTNMFVGEILNVWVK